MISRRRRRAGAHWSLWTALAATPLAQAQRVDENAVEQAQDAFGLIVGQESIGLYSPNDARGFSPRQAGNIVIEGLYFDQQTEGVNQRIIERSTLRVGLGAQSYPFAAPTGVVDYRLRTPGTEQITSIAAGIGPHDEAFAEIDVQVPFGREVSAGFGFGYGYNDYLFDAQQSEALSAGGVLRWQPSATAEIVSFAGWAGRYEDKERPLVFLRAPVLPPKIDARTLEGQDWTYWNQDSYNYGTLAKTKLNDAWTLRAGAFHSLRVQGEARNEYLFVTAADGSADYFIAGVPRQTYESTSGEIRLTHDASIDGSFQHRFHVIGRARSGERRYGGDDERFIATTRLGERVVVPEQSFSMGPKQRIDNTQVSVGAAYAAMWDEIGEVSVGAQRTSFDRRTQDNPAAERLDASDAAWLYNGSFALRPARRLTVFGSYSRGLEESGTAPENASNRRQSAPLTISEQIDLGVRYVLSSNLSLVLAGFEIEKPYYGVNAQNLFTEIGLVRHRGVEASLTGELIKDLNVVIGVVHIDPELSGEKVESGESGRTPVGPAPDFVSADFSYSPPWLPGFALESSVEYSSSRVASRDNTLELPSSIELNAGFRHKFQAGQWRVSVRLQAMNLTNERSWEVESSGFARLNDARRYSLSVTADR